jgi:hypothetical protein
MNADTLQTYKHSGKFNPLGLVLAIGAAAAVGFPLGLAYAYIVRWIPFIYVNFFATLGYGFAVGWVTSRILKTSQVRNTSLAALAGLAAGLIALYMEWSGTLHALFEGSPWFFLPDEVMRGMSLLYEQGSWGLRSGGNVTGVLLAVVWVVEAGIIVGLAVMIPFGFVGDTPFCEKNKCWLDEDKTIDTLERFTDPVHLATLKAGDILPITQAKPKTEGAKEFTRLLLKRSPRCKIFCTLRVQHVTLTTDTKGNVTVKTNDLTADLVIPASMFDLIAQFEEFTPAPSPAV